MTDMIDFYENDEGMIATTILSDFGGNEVEIVYLEAEETDQLLIDSVDFLFSHQKEMHNNAKAEISFYTQKVYQSKETDLELLKVYIFQGEREQFGLLFRWLGDTEHGVGVRFSGIDVKKVGPADIAFT